MLAERVVSHPSPVIRLSTVLPLALDRKVSMQIILARIHWLQGRPDQASALAKECVERADSDIPCSLCEALAFAACPIALWTGDLATAGTFIERLTRQGTERNVGYYHRWGMNFRRILAARETSGKGPRRASAGQLDIDVDDDKQRDLFATLGDFDGSVHAIERAERGIGGWCAPEILRAHGQWLLRQDKPDPAGARDRFRQALDMARRQGALSWELRAAMSLLRLQRESEQAGDAKQLLAAVHGRFTEGFETADLVEAQCLLDGLAD
jgi:hypothetical protein